MKYAKCCVILWKNKGRRGQTIKKDRKTFHLSKILELQPFMKIAIDDEVQSDENGNYLINIAYLRVSTDRQAELGFGLDIQENDVVRYSKANELKNLVLFIDDGFTGTNMDRPALQEIITYINDFNAGKSHIRIENFIISRIDRLGRTLLGTLQFIQDYIVCQKDSKNSAVNRNKEDINFISVAENYCRIDRNNPQGKFLLMLFASLAEFDRDLIVEKLKRGRTSRVASGKWIGGGKIPYGYRYDKSTGILVIEPKEAEVVREIFRLYLEEKMPPQKIAERFGFSGDRSITQILQRKSLTGCIIWNGEEYEGQHKAIIPLETWEAAQEELRRRSVHRTDSHYLLSGLLYCGECGAKMRYQKWSGGSGAKIVCYSTQRSTMKGKPYLVKDENCPSVRFWANDVETAVVSELFRLSYLGNEENKKSANTVEPIGVLLKELSAERKRLSRLYDFDDDDSDDVLKEKIQDCKRRIANIQKQISDEEEKKLIGRKVDNARKIFRTLKDTWPEMNEKEKQTVCQELIDRVIIYKDGTIDVHLKLKSFLFEQKNT